MKRKKGFEAQQARIGNQKANIQAMLDSLEEATMNVDVFNAQRQGAQAVKKIYGDELLVLLLLLIQIDSRSIDSLFFFLSSLFAGMLIRLNK